MSVIETLGGAQDWIQDQVETASKIPNRIIDFGVDVNDFFKDLNQELADNDIRLNPEGDTVNNVLRTEARSAGIKAADWLSSGYNWAFAVAGLVSLVVLIRKA